MRKRFLSNSIGNFEIKKTSKIEEGNLYLTENRLSRNKICCAEDNHSYMSKTWPKEFQIRTLIEQLLPKYRFFKKLPKISHIHKNRNF